MIPWLAFLFGCWVFCILRELPYFVGGIDKELLDELMPVLDMLFNIWRQTLIGASMITGGYLLAQELLT